MRCDQCRGKKFHRKVTGNGYFMRSVGPQICSRCGKPHYEPTDSKRKKP